MLTVIRYTSLRPHALGMTPKSCITILFGIQNKIKGQTFQALAEKVGTDIPATDLWGLLRAGRRNTFLSYHAMFDPHNIPASGMFFLPTCYTGHFLWLISEATFG